MSDEKDEKLENEAETPEHEAAEEALPEAEGEPGSDPTDDPADKPKKRRRRRGSAETTTTAKRATVAAPRDATGKVAVRAQARYVRCAPRKARLVVDHIRGKSVEDARAILATTPRAAARDVLKLLDSAIANAENNHELVADELRVGKVFVDEGPTLKRFQPRAQGRATRIRKRTSHMTILLTTKEDI
jgi:ribosomal protein L22